MKQKDIFIYAVILLAAFLVLTPIIVPRVWHPSHEGARYIFLFDHFRDAAAHGILYPRWLPDLCGGYGYPTFLFYQPGFFFAALPFSLLPGYPLSAMYTTLVFLFFAGGVGVYKLGKELSDRLTGLFCSIFFLLTPYLYVNLYVRGDLTELMAMLLCAWPVFFLVILKRRIRENASPLGAMMGIAASLILVIISHPATPMFFLPVFSLCAVYISFDRGFPRRKFLLRVTASVLLGLILSAPYWLTVFQMKKYVNLEPAYLGHPYFSAELHTVSFQQLFSRKWEFGISVPNSARDGMSFQLGLPHFILATIGFLAGRKERMIQAGYALYLILILLMTPWASILWKEIIFFRYVQFPWRILSVTAVLQIICVSGLKNILPARISIRNRGLAISALLGISLLWYSNQFQIRKNALDGREVRRLLNSHRENKLETFHTYTCLNEFMPGTALKHRIEAPRASSSLLVMNPPGEIKELKGHNRYRMRYRLISEVPANVLINQFYMPGWRVIVDGDDISPPELERNLTMDGRIQFSLSPGESHTVEAFYEGPPGWRVRNIVIGTLFLGFVAFGFYEQRSHSQK